MVLNKRQLLGAQFLHYRMQALCGSLPGLKVSSVNWVSIHFFVIHGIGVSFSHVLKMSLLETAFLTNLYKIMSLALSCDFYTPHVSVLSPHILQHSCGFIHCFHLPPDTRVLVHRAATAVSPAPRTTLASSEGLSVELLTNTELKQATRNTNLRRT